MRTDTNTFAKTAFKAVRALGINSVNSRSLARQIVSVLAHGGYNAQGEVIPSRREIADFKVNLNLGFWGPQYVAVIIGGEVAFTVTIHGRQIVSTQPTARQLELHDAMIEALEAVRDASAFACRVWEDANGYPATNEAADRRYEEVRKDAGYIAALAAYNALRDESLALNPFAPARIVDTMTYGTFSDWHKEEVGWRPGSNQTLAEVRAWMERESAAQSLDIAA